MPRNEFVLELELRHYPTEVDFRQMYSHSIFPEPLITIDVSKHGEPMKIVAVGPAVFTVAGALSKGWESDSRLVQLIEQRCRELGRPRG